MHLTFFFVPFYVSSRMQQNKLGGVLRAT